MITNNYNILDSILFMEHLNYIKVNLFLMYKKLIEYKFNMFNVILLQIFYVGTQMIFFFLISDIFADVVSWTFVDYMLYSFFLDILFQIAGTLSWGKFLTSELKSGNFQLLLNKPGNPLFKYLFGNFFSTSVLFIFSSMFILIGFILYNSVELFNLGLSLLVFINLIYLWLVTHYFIESLDFYTFGLNMVVFRVYNTATDIFHRFPAPFFSKFEFKKLFYIFPFFGLGSLFLPLIRNLESFNLMFQWSLVFGFSVLFTIGVFINWYYGLKKFEAFG